MISTYPPPLFFSWESTLACQLNCTHCGLNAGQRRRRELKTDEAVKMLHDLAAFGVRYGVMSGGEFTLRKDWLRLLTFALALFSEVRLISNGMLGEQLLAQLDDLRNNSKLCISVSVDGGEAVHNQRRQNNLSFQKVQEILARDSPITKTVITTVGQDNFQELETILALCLKWSVKIWSVQLALPAGRMKQKFFLGQAKIKELAEFIAVKQRELFGALIIVPDDCYGYRLPMRRLAPWQGCPGAKKMITILANGAITGCPTWLTKICGNIRADKLGDIWNSPKMAALRLRPVTCQNCQLCPGGCQTVAQLFNQQFCFK